MMIRNFNIQVILLLCLSVNLFLLITSPATNGDEKYISGQNENEVEATEFLHDDNQRALKMCNEGALAKWNYDNNLTEYNKQLMLEQTIKAAKFDKERWKNATRFAWMRFKNSEPEKYRWFKFLSVLGDSALPEEKLTELKGLIADMTETYGKATICESETSCSKPLALEPELTELFASSRDYDQLAYAWDSWRNVTGKRMKGPFLKYVNLKNEAAKLNGFKDAGDLWRDSYESPTFVDDIKALFNDFKPFYQQLHAYVRRKLIEKHPGKIRRDGPIPAQLLGNMWAQQWGNIFDIIEPYPGEAAIDITPIMQQRNMTSKEMFEMSDEFFTSLGLKKMTAEFWRNSVMEKPTDREIVCHASAWDFCDGKDVRIKMCTRVNMEDFVTVHHEMGHIEYYLQYAHQPSVFRNGANPGFHEAVGDTLALSVSTPKHLKQIGFLDTDTFGEKASVNFLMKMALDKMAFLPFAFALDSWRWNVFNGKIPTDEMNNHWWNFRLEYQGLCPPTRRTNDDLDPAAKYHVISDVPYIRYFVSFVVQFQFHKALCEEAGHTGPLHECDIYRNKNAGDLLSRVLDKGNSVTWNRAMSIMTKGKTDKMDISGILEYFNPLLKWLKEQNKDEQIGWYSNDSTLCPQ